MLLLWVARPDLRTAATLVLSKAISILLGVPFLDVILHNVGVRNSGASDLPYNNWVHLFAPKDTKLLGPLGPSGKIPDSGCIEQYLETSFLALQHLLLLLATCPPLLHADSVSFRNVYTHLDILVADDISHNVVAHSDDGETLRGIVLLREFL